MAHDVSLSDVIDHIQAMEQRLTRRIDVVDAQLSALKTQLTQAEAKLSWQIDIVDKRIEGSIQADRTE